MLSPMNLKEIIETTQTKKEKTLFVFDIDSTLFCMKYRTQALIDSCLKSADFCKKFKPYLQKIKEVEVTETDWSIQEIMTRYGLHPEEEVVTAIQAIWKKGFFSNDYLHLDQPYENCVRFVQYIAQLKAQIYYLTARNYNTMVDGTILSLKKWGFPLKNESHLIMKKDSKISDTDHKVNHLQDLSQKFDTILFFENEPVILNRVAQALPKIQLFWMNSTHSRREQPPKTAFTLNMKYSFE